MKGSYLSGLETLVVKTGSYTPKNLDQFMDRLGHSSAAKTLRSLSIEEPFGLSLSLARTVSLDAFLDCVCNLSALEDIKIKYVSIGGHSDPTFCPRSIMVPEQRRVASMSSLCLSYLNSQRILDWPS